MPAKPSGPLRVSTYIAVAEVRLLQKLLCDFQLQTISNVDAKTAESLLEKIRSARELSSMVVEFAPEAPAS